MNRLIRRAFNFAPPPVHQLKMDELIKVTDHTFIFSRNDDLHVARVKVDVETDELIPYEYVNINRDEWNTIIEQFDESLFEEVNFSYYTGRPWRTGYFE